MFDIDEQIQNLMILDSNLSSVAVMTTEIMEARAMVANATNELINIRDVQIPAIQSQVVSMYVCRSKLLLQNSRTLAIF